MEFIIHVLKSLEKEHFEPFVIWYFFKKIFEDKSLRCHYYFCEWDKCENFPYSQDNYYIISRSH